MFSWLSFGKSILKSKWFWVAITTLVVAIYVSKYTSLVEDVQRAYSQIESLSNALETTNESINTLRKDMALVDKYVVEQREGREQIREELENVREQLEQERKNNEKLQECWGVSHGNAFDGLLPPTTKD